MRGAYPFNEAAFKAGLRKGVVLGLLFSLFTSAIVFGLVREAHAEPWPKVEFSEWPAIPVSKIKTPDPVVIARSGSYGAVNRDYKQQTALPSSCVKKDKNGDWVVSMSCAGGQ